MSEHKKPDDLTKTTKPGNIDLNEEELGRVSGGAIGSGTGSGNIKIKLTDKTSPLLNTKI